MNRAHVIAEVLANILKAEAEKKDSPVFEMEVYFHEKGQISIKEPPGTPGGPRYYNIKVSESI